MIKLQIVGNLGKDCVVNTVNGRNVINFSVAHTDRYKDAQGVQKERTTWVECAYWTDRTGVAEYLKKGKMVYAEGAPEADGYLNKDNQPAATLRMRVSNIQLLGGSDNPNTVTPQFAPSANQGNVTNRGDVHNQGASTAPAMQNDNAADPVDDLPF